MICDGVVGGRGCSQPGATLWTAELCSASRCRLPRRGRTWESLSISAWLNPLDRAKEALGLVNFVEALNAEGSVRLRPS